MARTRKTAPTTTADTIILPDLAVKDADVKYTGSEPIFTEQPVEHQRTITLMRAYNWYSRYCDRKVAREQLALYTEKFDTDGTNSAKQIRKVDESSITTSYGWLARLALRGLILTPDEKAKLGEELLRLTKIKNKAEPVAEVKPAVNVTNVQEIMRERARDAAGDLEGCLDDFIQSGAKSGDATVNVVGILTEHNILPQHASIILEPWKRKQREFEEVLEGKDPQLVEGYSQYTKHQIKAILKFAEAVIAGVDNYLNVKKANRAPRKRKAVSPEKQVAKLKFLKEFKELGLTSVQPAKLVGATEVWAYDTAKRKLHYYIADSMVGSLGVKGTTILGFDTVKSGMKTLRKPAEQLKKLMGAGKPATRKLFSEINAVHAQPNGRTNENLIILKVF